MSVLLSRVRRSALVATVAGLLLALFLTSAPSQPQDRTREAASTVGTWTPVTGATFNRPIGTVSEQRAIFRQLGRAINSTPPGATIRFAVFSFNWQQIASSLIRAYHRGVNVQLVFDAHAVYPQEKRLQKVLGTKPWKSSFVRLCSHSCRGVSGGNMHDKIFLFSHVGSADNVVMVGSDNLTGYNAERQWSDMYTVVGDAPLYWTYAGVFDQLKQDRPVSTPYIRADVDGYEAQFYPYPGTTEATDPLTLMLSKVQCTATNPDGSPYIDPTTGAPLRTSLRISQHAWNGSRGKYLARQVATLQRSGCDVAVIYGVGMGLAVKSILQGAGVPMSGGTVKGVRTHQKTLLVSGMYDGDPQARIVFTGSHNWTNGALRRDETIFKITGQQAYDQYLANWNDIWNNG